MCVCVFFFSLLVNTEQLLVHHLCLVSRPLLSGAAVPDRGGADVGGDVEADGWAPGVCAVNPNATEPKTPIRPLVRDRLALALHI